MEYGFLLINKPEDWTSHDVIAYLRGVLHIKKIGHAGTLDPFATGLLIVAVGRPATKQLSTFKDLKKTYEATIRLGATSNTQDKTGNITNQNIKESPTLKQIKKVLQTFQGKSQQIPPMYSAKKIQGKKLYELARKGKTVKRQPHDITIYDIELLTYDFPELKIRTVTSPGTYIRTLAHDIGEKLGTGAYCEKLSRTQIGPYRVEDAVGPRAVTIATKEKFLRKNLEENTIKKEK